MAVTIPSVINSMNSSKHYKLENAADTVSDWFTKNYELSNLSGTSGAGSADVAYNKFMADKEWITTSNGTTRYGILYLCVIADGSTEVHCDDVMDSIGITKQDYNINGASARLVGNKICVRMSGNDGKNFYSKGCSESDFRY